MTSKQFIEFAAKAGLPEKPVRDAVESTVLAFARVWGDSEAAGLEKRTRSTIDRHLTEVPLWKELVGRGKGGRL